MENATSPKLNMIGVDISRVEDDRLLTGRGQFSDDVKFDDGLHVKFLRSPYPSGKITEIDIKDTLVADGVVAVFTAEDTRHLAGVGVNPIIKGAVQSHYPILADGMVMAVGQPVVAVVATSAAAANDAVDTIFLDVDFEEAVTKIEPEGGTPIFKDEDSNICFSQEWSCGDVRLGFENAPITVSAKIKHSRVAPCSMETRTVSIHYDEGQMTVWLSSQTPHRAKADFTRILELPESKIEVISTDVGGAFGMKASLYPEEILSVWVANQLRTSLRWVSSRGEDLQAGSHGRGVETEGTLAVSASGKFLALKAKSSAPVGHWLTFSATVPSWNAVRILPGPYDVKDVFLNAEGQLTNTAPVGIYRGAGRPEAAMLMERLVDKAARALNLDPIEIRKKNFLSPEQLPHVGASGRRLDSGDYTKALDQLCKISNYDELCEKQSLLRKEGKLVGIGIACYVEPCGRGWESAHIKWTTEGKVIATTGTSSQGHGRETAFAQIIADILPVSFDDITIKHGATKNSPEGIGALASRSTAIGGSALKLAAEKLQEKITMNPHSEHEVEHIYEADGEAWGYGAYLASVSIDSDTGVVKIEDIFCVDDAGILINPMLVEGQIMGGLAQGIGEALMERIVYDDGGQLMTGSLMDYALPLASDIPNITISKMETPSPCNPLGAKGVGEAGTIGAPAAIMNAVLDALEPFGVKDLNMPLTSETIWRAMNDAQAGEE